MCEFKDILEGKGSLFLNLQNAGGNEFLGRFFVFHLQPLYFLVAFVEKWQMMRFANILVLLKMMLCAGCASIFFDRVFPKLRPVFVIILSVSYAFCGYTMLFYQNMVWLDMMYLFPFFCCRCGVWQKPIPGAVCIFSGGNDRCQFLSGVYAGFVPDLGSWYLDLFFSPRATRGQRTVQLAAGTLGAALLSAVIWIPALLQYLNSARGGNLFRALEAAALSARWTRLGCFFYAPLL